MTATITDDSVAGATTCVGIESADEIDEFCKRYGGGLLGGASEPTYVPADMPNLLTTLARPLQPERVAAVAATTVVPADVVVPILPHDGRNSDVISIPSAGGEWQRVDVHTSNQHTGTSSS